MHARRGQSSTSRPTGNSYKIKQRPFSSFALFQRKPKLSGAKKRKSVRLRRRSLESAAQKNDKCAKILFFFVKKKTCDEKEEKCFPSERNYSTRRPRNSRPPSGLRVEAGAAQIIVAALERSIMVAFCALGPERSNCGPTKTRAIWRNGQKLGPNFTSFALFSWLSARNSRTTGPTVCANSARSPIIL